MKEFIDKLISRLEESAKIYIDDDGNMGFAIPKNKAISTVNQLAEEYNNESVKTNADYIRNMTDDELAMFLASADHYTDEGECIVVFEGEPLLDDIVSIEEWLKEKREG